MQYGLRVPGLVIDGQSVSYDVLNDRAIRAGAGIMFVLGFGAMMYTLMSGDSPLTRDYGVLMVILPIFWSEFAIRTLLTPRWSPLSILAGLMVSNQKPEYVGAVQKRFAWGIGLFLASIMMILVFVVGYRGVILFAICGTCLLFMRLETSVGLCVGCKIYYRLRDKNLISDPGYRPACPGGSCSIKRPPQS